MRIDARRAALIGTWVAVTPWALWALARFSGIRFGFPIAEVLALTPLAALTAILPVILALVLRNFPAAVVGAVAFVALAIAVLPRAFGGPTSADGGTGAELRLVAANMRLGKGDADALVQLVREREADVLSVEELTPKLARELDQAGLRQLLPDRSLALSDGSSGSGIYARAGLGPGATETLPGGFPLIREALAVPGARHVELLGVHTRPPIGDQAGDWSRDLAAIPAPIDQTLRIALGDFNATLDHAQFRELLDRGYKDAGATLGDGLTGTWPASRRTPPFAAIDHVLSDGRIGIRDYAVDDIPGSDHRAVYAELAIPTQ